MLDWSLLGGPLPALLIAAGAVGVTLLLRPRGGRRRWWLRMVPAALAAGLCAVGILVVVVAEAVPEALPLTTWAWVGAVAVAVALAMAAGRAGARWIGVAAAALLVTLSAASGINSYYGQFPTVRTALGLGYADQAEFAAVAPLAQRVVHAHGDGPLDAAWSPPAGMPATGQVSQVDIPGTVSGFPARQGWVYLPPAYLSGVRAKLPVLVLLHGQPGDPGEWLDGGQLADRMDRYAAQHSGLAPVVVMPDDLGSEFADPLCLDSQLGNAATYLTVDVPAWIRHHLQVDADPAKWAVGGLSYGGTCALQLALTAPQLYPTFVDISGQAGPTLGTRADTVHAAFGTRPGADAAFRAVDPLGLLLTHRYLATAGVLVAGADDAEFLPQARTVRAALEAAHVPVTLTVLPGAHTWGVWGPGLESALPWLGTRMGITS